MLFPVRSRIVLCLATLFIGYTTEESLCDEQFAERLNQVDALFADCDRADAPGCAVGIISHGKLIYQKGFGSAHLDYDVPNTPDTVFEMASASKSFTSACIALLMDQGKVLPDDDVRKFLPELQPHDPPVRIRDMLRCESGIWAQFHIMPLAGWGNVPIPATYSKADFLEVLAGQKTMPFKPGTDFQYSSGDFFLLGIVVERVTGKTVAQFAKQNFFDPNGMKKTYYEEDSGMVVKNRSVGHWKGDEGWSSQGPRSKSKWRKWQANAYIAGGGGVNSTIRDLYLWDQAFQQNKFPKGKYMQEFREHGMVLGNRFNLDLDAYRKRVHPKATSESAGQYRGLKRMQFTGGFWGLSTCMSRFPEEQFTVICLSNSGEVSAFRKAREIADLFLGDKMQPAPKSDDTPTEEKFIELELADLQALTGEFRDKDTTPIWQTSVRLGRLMLMDHLDKVYELKPLSPTRFKPVGDTPFYDSARFEFTLDDSGSVKTMVLSSNENGFHEVISFKRVKLDPPPTEKLAEYRGTYTSEELGATYRFKVDQDALWLRVNSRRWEKLRPLTREEFTPLTVDPHDQRFLKFTRNSDGELTGFTIAFWRIRGIQFSKQKT